MTCINFNKVTKSFGDKDVLRSVSFTLHAGLKAGLVGENGCGKSTILKLITGETGPDSGLVELAGAAVLSYVPQLPDASQAVDAVHAVLGAGEVAGLYAAVVALERERNDKEALEYADLVARFNELGGYELAAEARRHLNELGLDESIQRLPFASLSGGERSRAGLAGALMSRPGVLLLDEPDAHLDLQGLAWLEEMLQHFKGTLLLVSHDRDLLESCTEAVLELEDGKASFEHGRLSAYFERKRRRLAEQLVQYEQQQRKVKKLKRDIRRTEDRGRRFDNLSTNDYHRRIGKKIAKTALVRKRKLEKELAGGVRIERPEERERISLKVHSAVSRSDTLLYAENLEMHLESRCLFRDVTLQLAAGRRIALTGPNGCGKTTLLEVLLNRREFDGGEVWLAKSADVFYCDQHNAGLDKQHSAFEVLDDATALSVTQIHYLLSQIGLKRQAIRVPVGVLSGGEQTRLLLALLVNSRANLLVLDEPTSHLDLPSIEVLESSLKKFAGAVLFISHDRRFIRNVATDVLEFRECRVTPM